MAQPLQNINIAAPAFKGLNTQDSPLSGDPTFASVADNVVIDSYGRIGSRRGLTLLTTDATEMGSERPHVIHEYEDAAGNTKVFSVANGKILSGTTTLVDETPASYTVADPHYQIVNFNDNCYFFNNNVEPLVYNTTLGAVTKMSAVSGYSGTAPQGSIALGAFGRLWVSGDSNYPNMVYWSDLLIGQAWNTGTAGSLNLDKVWPDGSDRVTGLAAWNNHLVIFGYNSIVIYKDAESPSIMSLADTISGIGCVSRNSIQGTGNDLLFLSARGVMSLGRTIQENSAPLRDVSMNIRDDLINLWKLQDEEVYSCYSARFGFYLLVLPTNSVVYCFDVRAPLENGAFRVTRWTTDKHYSFAVRQDDTILVGNYNGISTYSGYEDNGEPYTARYYSNPLNFGDPSHIKFLKKITPTLIGGATTTFAVKWAYDFGSDYKAQTYTLGGSTIAYYNESEYNDAEYTAGTQVSAPRINCTGSGNLVTIGLEATIDGAPISIQEFNIQATIGRMY